MRHHIFEKQINRLVGFGTYTYNTAEGGGVTGTFTDHQVMAGLAYKNPFNVNGEVALGYLYMHPMEEILGKDARSQSGLEAYWRVSLTRNIWVTPGIHLVFNPTLNPETNFSAIPHIKFRLAL